MKIRNTVAFVCTIALCSAAGLAQNSTPTKPAEKPAAPAAQPKMEKPAGKPGMGTEGKNSSEGMMAQMMEKCMVAGTPGPMHEWLTKSAGTWEGQCTFWMPGMPESKSTCTTVITTMFDGKFVKGETNGMMDMGGQQMPFHGFMISGYNNTTKQFEQTWIDSMGTMMMNSVGKVSDDHKTLTWSADFVCPMTEKPIKTRMIETHTGDNTMTLEMWGPSPIDGKDTKSMEIKYTRKGDAPKAMPKTDDKHDGHSGGKPDAKPAGK